MNEWCFRSQFYTVRLYWAGDCTSTAPAIKSSTWGIIHTLIHHNSYKYSHSICCIVPVCECVCMRKGVCVCLCVCVPPVEGNVVLNATPNPFLLNKMCLNQFIPKFIYVQPRLSPAQYSLTVQNFDLILYTNI